MADKEKELTDDLMPSLVSGMNSEVEDDTDYIDRLWSFGEGYFDFTTYNEIFGDMKDS